MRILVTGATGRVGSRLAAALLDRGHEVRTVVLPDDPHRQRAVHAGIECITGSIGNVDDVRKAVDGVDVVFHLAALILFRREDQGRLWTVNMQGTYNVFQAAVDAAGAQRARPLRLIFASSDQVYPGPTPLYRPTDEAHPYRPNTFYGLTKVLGEEMLQYYGRAYPNVQISVARFTHTEAPEELIDPDGFFARRLFFVNGRLHYLREGGSTDPAIQETIRVLEPLSAPDEPLLLPREAGGDAFELELTDVRDIVRGLLLILERKEAVGETFNLTPPSTYSFAEIIPYMAEATGRRYVEAELPISSPRCHASGAKARSLLGYRPYYTIFDMIDEAVGRDEHRSSPASAMEK